MRLNWRTVLLRVGISIGVALLTIAYAGAVVPQDGVVDWREALLTVTGLIVSSGLLLSIPAHWGREGIRHLINQLHAARARKRPSCANGGGKGAHCHNDDNQASLAMAQAAVGHLALGERHRAVREAREALDYVDKRSDTYTAKTRHIVQSVLDRLNDKQ